MSSPATEFPDRIPHRFLVLRALRCMARGRPFIVVNMAFSWGLILEGVPYASALFNYFLDHEWLQPLKLEATSPGVLYYGLSARGLGFLERGESWWSQLGLTEKMGVWLLG